MTRAEAEGQKRLFLFQITAPTDWTPSGRATNLSGSDENEADAVTDDEADPEATQVNVEVNQELSSLSSRDEPKASTSKSIPEVAASSPPVIPSSPTKPGPKSKKLQASTSIGTSDTTEDAIQVSSKPRDVVNNVPKPSVSEVKASEESPIKSLKRNKEPEASLVKKVKLEAAADAISLSNPASRTSSKPAKGGRKIARRKSSDSANAAPSVLSAIVAAKVSLSIDRLDVQEGCHRAKIGDDGKISWLKSPKPRQSWIEEIDTQGSSLQRLSDKLEGDNGPSQDGNVSDVSIASDDVGGGRLASRAISISSTSDMSICNVNSEKEDEDNEIPKKRKMTRKTKRVRKVFSSSSSESEDEEKSKKAKDDAPINCDAMEEDEEESFNVTYSQVEEIITLDSDADNDEPEPEPELAIKEEAPDLDEAEKVEPDLRRSFDDDEEGEKSDEDVVYLGENELDDSQMQLFQKIVSKIKKERDDSSFYSMDVSYDEDDILGSPILTPPPEELDQENAEAIDDFIVNDMGKDRETSTEEDEDAPSQSILSNDVYDQDTQEEEGDNDTSNETGERLDEEKEKPKNKAKQDAKEDWQQALDFSDDDEPSKVAEPDKEEEEKDTQMEDPEPVPSTSEPKAKDQAKKKDGSRMEQKSKKHEVRKPMLIDALPQPARRAHCRGISEASVKKLTEQRENEEIERELSGGAAASKEVKSSSKANMSPKAFYGAKPKFEKKGKGQNIYQRAEEQQKQNLELRKQKLREIAERADKPSAPQAPKARAPTKVKQSQPKASKLMECNLFSRPSLPPKRDLVPRPKASRDKLANLREPTQPEGQAKSRKSSADNEAGPSSSSSGFALPRAPPPRGGIRMTAETEVTNDGHRRVKKMSFGNVISNVLSQDLGNLELPKAAPLNIPIALNRSAGGKKKKRVTWRTDENLVQIRPIPREGLGRKVGSTMSKSFDTRSLAPAADAGKGMGFTAIKRDILNWMPKWLVEQEKIKEPPPVHGDRFNVSHVPNVFTSYKDYCNTFYPLLLHELWAAVYEDYKTQHVACMNSLAVCRHLDFDRNNPGLLVGWLVRQLSTNEFKKGFFSEGWLIKVSIPIMLPGATAERTQYVEKFAYVEECRVRPRRGEDGQHLHLMGQSEKHRRNGRHLAEMMISMKFLEPNIRPNLHAPWKVNGISRIRPFLKNIQAVEDVQKSPLFHPILKPNPKTFSVGFGDDDIRPDIAPLPQMKNLNEKQTHIVKSVARVCTSVRDANNICLVQGPPGTGKTTTIVATILQIFSRHRHYHREAPLPRILLCAPSNAAVDEITKRLMWVDKERTKFNLMRMGRDDAVAPEVRDITFERLREKEMQRRVSESTNHKSIELERRTRQEAINRLGEQITLAKDDQAKIDLLNRKIKAEMTKLQRAKDQLNQKTLPEKERAELRQRAGDDLLEHADVIAVTLNSSMNYTLERYFTKKAVEPSRMNSGHRRFSICVMDEASQCMEPEALVPLAFGFNKLVLVGDPEQLPATVKSQKAKKNSLQSSMFKRMYDALSACQRAGEPSLIQMLQTQYRMHREIMQWPSNYFYGGGLACGPQKRDCGLKPYALLDLDGKETVQGSQIWNEAEAKYLSLVVKSIFDHRRARNESVNISVITFYSRMRQAIEHELRSLGFNRPHCPTIVVNTIDSFQGSESDIVLISCVRTGKNIGFLSHSERLNVALTRARQALYIVGKLAALKVSSLFFSCVFLELILFFLQNDNMWKQMIEDARRRNKVIKASLAQEPHIFLQK